MNHTISSDIIRDSGIAFGTSGARGLVEQFTPSVCAAFTVAFLSKMRTDFSASRVAIAIDRRPSSPSMAAACASAAKNLGFEVDYYGVIPTPALALQAASDECPAIMVTGSHIPFDRNGIKFYRPDGEITKEDEISIVQSDAPISDIAPSLPEESVTARQKYIDRYLDLYPENALKDLKVGVYEHSAAGRHITIEILISLGASVVSLDRTETFVPIDTEAVSEEDRKKGLDWSQIHGLDAILSTDGDGDRPLMADENGRWLRGDILCLLCAQSLKIEALAVPVSCNTAIEMTQDFKTVSRTRIGSPYVIESMMSLTQSHDTVAGFEANGGFLLGTDIKTERSALKALPTRDAILPMLQVLTLAARKKVGVSTLTSLLPSRYTASDRIKNFPTKNSQAFIAKWEANPAAFLDDFNRSEQIVDICLIDGFRVTLDSGDIVHLRPSGNAPELRCYAESDSIEKANTLTGRFLTIIPNL